jgi:hypothetical protein
MERRTIADQRGQLVKVALLNQQATIVHGLGGET